MVVGTGFEPTAKGKSERCSSESYETSGSSDTQIDPQSIGSLSPELTHLVAVWKHPLDM